jgi:hypothetical protein
MGPHDRCLFRGRCLRVGCHGLRRIRRVLLQVLDPLGTVLVPGRRVRPRSMTTYFDLARAELGRPYKSPLRLAMSAENAARMLTILGERAECYQFLGPERMKALLEVTNYELKRRAAGSGDPRVRYEIPRLVQLQCLFDAASRRQYGVAVWQEDLSAPGDAGKRK